MSARSTSSTLAVAPPPAPDDVARWLLRCMRGRTEGGSFKDPDQGRAVMDEALMSCRVLLERTKADDVVAEVEDLRLMARSWLVRYTQLNAQSSPWASASALGPVPLEVRYPGHSAHALGLRRQFAHRITYRTEQARQAVESFNVDCRGPDGRFLPLSNVILAKLASMSAEHAHLEVDVDSRGDEVRITDVLVDRNGQEMHRTLAFEIDRWGELKVRNGRVQAVLNACYGGWGEIWVMATR